MRISRFILIIISILLFASCSGGGEKKGKAAGVTTASAPYELLVVANKDWLKTPAGQSLTVVLESPIIGLPQPESNFRVTKINPEGLNKTFKAYANIVIADIGSKYKEKGVKVARDLYCHPQLIMYLEAPNNEEFMELVKENAELILQMFNEQEFERERRVLAKKYSPTVMEQAKKQFGVGIKAPEELDEVKVGKNFFWASASKLEFKLNVCMYTLPLRDLSLEEFAEKRDSVMRINIPGNREDQWMETDARTISASRWTSADGKQTAMTVRGLWDMRNDAMGGPFVCYIEADSENNRLLVTEGFCFCPQEKKRPIMRKLEASLQTITHF